MNSSDGASIVIEGSPVPVEIHRRKGTKKLRLRLGYQNQIIASVPWRCTVQTTLRFVEAQRSWLERQLAQAPQARTIRAGSWRTPGSVPVVITFMSGRTHGQARADYTFEQSGADLVFRLPQPETEGALLRVVRSFAKDALTCRVAYHAKRLGLSIPPCPS